MSILRINFHITCTNSNFLGYFLAFFSLCLLRDFSHLCQLLLQLYISMKSLSCLGHKVCSHGIPMQQMHCFVSWLHFLESLAVGGMVRAKKENSLVKKRQQGKQALLQHTFLWLGLHTSCLHVFDSECSGTSEVRRWNQSCCFAFYIGIEHCVSEVKGQYWFLE